MACAPFNFFGRMATPLYDGGHSAPRPQWERHHPVAYQFLMGKARGGYEGKASGTRARDGDRDEWRTRHSISSGGWPHHRMMGAIPPPVPDGDGSTPSPIKFPMGKARGGYEGKVSGTRAYNGGRNKWRAHHSIFLGGWRHHRMMGPFRLPSPMGTAVPHCL